MRVTWVLACHYADRRLFEERGPESAAEEPGRHREPGVRCRRPLVRPQSARGGARGPAARR
jgi:hypothetical protein